MEKKIAVLSGDGIGPEIINEAKKVLQAIEKKFNHKFIFIEGLIGAVAIDVTGNPYPDETHELCKSSDAILFGAIGDPKYDNNPSAKVRPEQGLLKMRKELGLFTNIRPVKSYKSLLHFSPLKPEIVNNVDFIVFRELTGGIYFGQPRGRSEDSQTAYDTCVYTVEEISRIAHLAFQSAKKRRNKLTLVDKANVLATSRLWRETIKDISSSYPEVKLDYMFVDNAAMKIIQQPKYFDVILTENMFGDIITDEASVITGSIGMLPSASTGHNISLFEPIHGSFSEATGKNIANPIATILSAAMMLEMSFKLYEEAKAIERAIEKVIDDGLVTQDLNRIKYFSTTEVGYAIVKNI